MRPLRKGRLKIRAHLQVHFASHSLGGATYYILFSEVDIVANLLWLGASCILVDCHCVRSAYQKQRLVL